MRPPSKTSHKIRELDRMDARNKETLIHLKTGFQVDRRWIKAVRRIVSAPVRSTIGERPGNLRGLTEHNRNDQDLLVAVIIRG